MATNKQIDSLLSINPGMDAHTAAQLADDADSDALSAELTAEDGIARLTSEQHRAAFRGPVVEAYPVGALVAADDSSTAGKVARFDDQGAWLTYADMESTAERPIGPYKLSMLRPWPLK